MNRNSYVERSSKGVLWGGPEGEKTEIRKASKNTTVARTKKDGRKEKKSRSIIKKKTDSIL